MPGACRYTQQLIAALFGNVDRFQFAQRLARANLYALGTLYASFVQASLHAMSYMSFKLAHSAACRQQTMYHLCRAPAKYKNTQLAWSIGSTLELTRLP